MNKKMINEINDIKYLFGYKRGVVISEQDIAEPEVMPDTDIDIDRDIKTRPNPFNPDRAREFNPFPDLEPQGEEEDDIYMSDTEVLEPEIAPDIDIDVAPSRPTRTNPFNPDRAREFNPFPDLEPQGSADDEVNEPFIDDPDTDYSESHSLEDLVAKYLNRRG
jgi:hypothetical protein